MSVCLGYVSFLCSNFLIDIRSRRRCGKTFFSIGVSSMTDQFARDGRKKALTLSKADRRLISPGQSLSDVVLPEKGSLDAGVLMMLHRGISVERLSGKSGWSASEVMVQVFAIVKRARLGLERRGGELFLVYPEAGLASANDAEQLREAVQAHRSETKGQPHFATTPKAEAAITL